MKRSVALIISVFALLALCSCGNAQVPSTSPSGLPEGDIIPAEPSVVTAPVAVVTHQPTPTPTATPVPAITAPPVAEPDRPATSNIAVYYGGESKPVKAELVRGSLSDSVGLGFSIYSDTKTYQYSFDNNANRFSPSSSGGSKASTKSGELTFMEILYIDGATSESLSPSFMDLYIDFDEIEFSAKKTIGESRLRCDVIVAYNNEQYISAYLADRANGLVAFVISCSTGDNDYHRPRLTAMLDTVAVFDTEPVTE